MDRKEILQQYTDEILELVKRDVATKETVFSALNCALTEYAIILTHQHMETLTKSLRLED